MSAPETARPAAPQPRPAGPRGTVPVLGSLFAGGPRILFGPVIAESMRTRKPREAWHGFHRGSWTRTVRSDAEVPAAPNPVASTAPVGSSFRAEYPLPPNPPCALVHCPFGQWNDPLGPDRDVELVQGMLCLLVSVSPAAPSFRTARSTDSRLLYSKTAILSTDMLHSVARVLIASA